MVRNEDGEIVERFNPSQVGYKLRANTTIYAGSIGFNPSQVGYKLVHISHNPCVRLGFNPSQVGYKLTS